MADFLQALHRFDNQKIQEARQAILNPGSIARRQKYALMDASIANFVNTLALDSDQNIKVVFYI